MSITDKGTVGLIPVTRVSRTTGEESRKDGTVVEKG